MRRQNGIDGLVLDLDEHRGQDDRYDNHGDGLGADPLELLASELDEEQDIQEEQGQEGYALDVDVLLVIADGRGELLDREDEGDERQRDVDVEAPVPADGPLDVSPYEGADTAADSEDGTQDALHPGPLAWRVQVGDGRGGDGDQDSSADSLDRAADDEHVHVGG